MAIVNAAIEINVRAVGVTVAGIAEVVRRGFESDDAIGETKAGSVCSASLLGVASGASGRLTGFPGAHAESRFRLLSCGGVDRIGSAHRLFSACEPTFLPSGLNH